MKISQSMKDVQFNEHECIRFTSRYHTGSCEHLNQSHDSESGRFRGRPQLARLKTLLGKQLWWDMIITQAQCLTTPIAF